MRTSRTRPTKLATAPTLASREIARTSAPSSKSSRWMATFIRCLSTSGDRREKGAFLPRPYRARPLRPLLVYRRAHGAVRSEDARPLAATCSQVLAQRADRVDVGGQLELLVRPAEALAQR